MKKIAVVGASGHGKVIADLAEACGYQVFFFDDAFPEKTHLEHWAVLGSFDDLFAQPDAFPSVFVAIGNNAIRAKLANQLQAHGFTLPVLIHPSAVISQYASIASGSAVLANVVVNAFAKVAQNCIINTAAVVEHDCILEEAVHLSPNVALAGNTKVNAFSWLGIGSVTKQGVEIGTNTIIGANSTVLENIPANVTAVGSPALIKK